MKCRYIYLPFATLVYLWTLNMIIIEFYYYCFNLFILYFNIILLLVDYNRLVCSKVMLIVRSFFGSVNPNCNYL